MDTQEKEVRFGDGVLDESLRTVNRRLSKLSNIAIESIFDDLEINAKDLPNDIKDSIAKVKVYFSQQANKPKSERRADWSVNQQKRGIGVGRELSPDDSSLSPEERVFLARIEGFHQGKKFEYQLAMLALAENNAPKELIIAVCNYLKEKGRRWDDRDREKIEQQYNEQKYLWDE